MRITGIRLSDFKAHDRLEIEPAEGLTIIRGPNEAGKSTIQQAIELGLFRKADANREDIREAHAWGSSEPPEVTLDFEVDGTSGSLRKRFDGSRSEARLTIGDEVVGDYALLQERVADLLGIPTEAFFRATASVGHAQLEAVAGDEPLLSDRLQHAVSGADRGTGKAKRKLDAAIHRYRTEGQKNPGLLKVAREEIAMLEGELASGEAALARLEQDRATWVAAHEQREQLDLQLRRQEADLAEARRAEDLASERDGAQDRYERLRRAADLVERAERIGRDMPTAMPLAQLRDAVKRAGDLESEVAELEAEIEAAAEDEDSGEAPPRPAWWMALAGGFVVAGWLALGLIGGVVGAAAVGAFALGTLLALVQSVRMTIRRRQWGLAQQLAARAAAERSENDREHQETFRRKRRELEAILRTIGVGSCEAAEELLSRTEENTGQVSEIEAELRGLGVEERNLRRLVEARDDAANETTRAGHALAALGRLSEDPAAAREAAQRLVERTRPARDKARSEEDMAQGRVDANTVDAEIVAGLAERLATAREQHAELERRLLIYQQTRQGIEDAERATLKTAARFLEERMGPTIERVTDGRYDEVEVDEKNLAFTVRAPETGELVEVDQLSHGTADQLYLAARLGLVRLVTMERRPPLIFDDPFVTFDAARAERALRLVKQVAAQDGFQVLYLTCSDRFDALADKLIVLEGPSSDHVLAAPRRSEANARGTGATAVTEATGSADEPGSAEATGSADEPGSAEAPAPTIRFEPDPRPNPVVDAPRRDQAELGLVAEPVVEPRPFAGRGSLGADAGDEGSEATS